MYRIVTTRFNNQTFEENDVWRRKNKWDGCIYGTPLQIRETFTVGCPLFVIEMKM